MGNIEGNVLAVTVLLYVYDICGLRTMNKYNIILL